MRDEFLLAFGGDEDNGGHGTDQRDIEDGDGKGGSGSPGHRA